MEDFDMELVASQTDDIVNDNYDRLENQNNDDRYEAMRICIELLKRADRNGHKIGYKAVLSVMMVLMLDILSAGGFSVNELVNSEDIKDEVVKLLDGFQESGLNIN